MYTELDLIENKKMDEIIKNNKAKVRMVAKKKKTHKVLDCIFYLVACGTFLIGLMFLISVIENMKF